MKRFIQLLAVMLVVAFSASAQINTNRVRYVAVSPSGACGKGVLEYNFTDGTLWGCENGTWAEISGGGGGGGDVVGPAPPVTDNSIARFDGTTGKLIKASPASICDPDLGGTAGYVCMPEGTAPTGLLGAGLVYPKTDHGLYTKLNAGSELRICSATGCGLSASGYYLSDGTTYYIPPWMFAATLPTAGTALDGAGPTAGVSTSGNARIFTSTSAGTANTITSEVASLGGNTGVIIELSCMAMGNTGATHNGGGCGVLLNETATVKSYFCGINFASLGGTALDFDVRSVWYNSLVAGGVQGAGTTYEWHGESFFRARTSGGNVTCEKSFNGVTWGLVDSRATTSVFTTAPDRAGPAILSTVTSGEITTSIVRSVSLQ